MSVKNFFVLKEDVVEMHITKGKATLVDWEDWLLVCGNSWCADGKYSSSKINRKKIALHRVLTGFKETDHRNHNELDNRRANLREVTRGQNNANHRKQPGTSSKWKGVSWRSKRQTWEADIRINGRTISLGAFEDEVDAATAYNFAAYNEWGEFAYLNDHPLNAA